MGDPVFPASVAAGQFGPDVSALTSEFQSGVTPGNGAPIETRTRTAVIATAGDVTYTAAQLLGGIVRRDPGAARADVTPTAAQIVAAIEALGITPSAGMCFSWLLVNEANAAEVITLTAGDGVTLIPSSVTPTQNESTRIIVYLDDVTAESEAVTMYCQTAGA